jgi:uncharacterized membrane protein
MITIFTNTNPLIIFAIATVSAIAIFIVLWLLMNRFYSKASNRWPFFNGFMKKIRRKGDTPLIKKYGLFGLALLMAIPIPTIGVYGGTLLSWMLGMKWRNSLIAVVSGATVSNSIVLLSVFGILKTI